MLGLFAVPEDGLFDGFDTELPDGLEAEFTDGLDAALPDGLACWPEGRATVPEDGLSAGLDTEPPVGLEAVLPDGLVCCPDGRATEPDGLLVWPDGRTADDFCEEVFDEDFCTEVDLDDPEDVREPLRWACADASDSKPNNAEPNSIEAKNILIVLIVEFLGNCLGSYVVNTNDTVATNCENRPHPFANNEWYLRLYIVLKIPF